MKLILASSSPRRAEILREAGIAFEIHSSEIDETPQLGETAPEMVARLAEAKVRAALPHCQIFTLAESLGAVESLIEHPASMTHAGMEESARLRAACHYYLL